MTDFVSRLLDAPARAAVRPVLRSVFEPGPELSPDPPAAEPASADAARVPPDSRPRARTGAVFAPAEPTPSRTEPRAATPHPPTPRTHGDLGAPAVVALGGPAAPARPVEPQARAGRAVPLGVPAVPRSAAPAAAVAAAPVPTVRAAAASHPVRAVPVTAQVAPLGRADAGLPRRAPARDAERSVHVTIGRVEVRAPVAAPPNAAQATAPRAPRTPKRPPVQGLNAYLSERGRR